MIRGVHLTPGRLWLIEHTSFTFRHAIDWRHPPWKLSCHRSLQDPSVAQNDRVDDLATLHAALSAVVR